MCGISEDNLDNEKEYRQKEQTPADPLAGVGQKDTFVIHGDYLNDDSGAKLSIFFKMQNKLCNLPSSNVIDDGEDINGRSGRVTILYR